jgi:hypothetical protein
LFIEMCNGDVICYPSEIVDFEIAGIPGSVRESMKEAIRCYAQQCWRAASIMIRRTIEEMCEECGATGSNLKARIATLKEKGDFPDALAEGADALSFLGNDGTHIAGKIFNDVGSAEIEAGLLIAMGMLRATYQSDA